MRGHGQGIREVALQKGYISLQVGQVGAQRTQIRRRQRSDAREMGAQLQKMLASLPSAIGPIRQQQQDHRYRDPANEATSAHPPAQWTSLHCDAYPTPLLMLRHSRHAPPQLWRKENPSQCKASRRPTSPNAPTPPSQMPSRANLAWPRAT